jgi:hypothetical protein
VGAPEFVGFACARLRPISRRTIPRIARWRLTARRRIHDHPLALNRPDRFHLHRRIDACLQQFLHARFPDCRPEPPNPGGIAWQLRRVVRQTAEVLLHHVLRPAFPPFFVADVEGVLQVEQGAIRRIGSRRRPAALGAAAAISRVVPNRFSPSITLPGRLL